MVDGNDVYKKAEAEIREFLGEDNIRIIGKDLIDKLVEQTVAYGDSLAAKCVEEALAERLPVKWHGAEAHLPEFVCLLAFHDGTWKVQIAGVTMLHGTAKLGQDSRSACVAAYNRLAACKLAEV